MRKLLAASALILAGCLSPVQAQNDTITTAPWSIEKANEWYASQPWLVGVNYTPQMAVNQLEMWQADTFDPATIDKELGWAESLGFNTIRVYLHNLLWQNDKDGLFDRMEQFLDIADSHDIKVMFVLFDSCWLANPKAGKQPEPTPFVHNSQWVQSPGAEILKDPAEFKKLKGYVVDIISRFRDDERVVVWDIWNEPDNLNVPLKGMDPPNKQELMLPLLKKAFAWAREARPSQPITSGMWVGYWDDPEALKPWEKVQIEYSDVISFHSYENINKVKRAVTNLQRYDRPIFCTEYMARPTGSTFDPIMGYFKEQKISAYNWGFVEGKTQTNFPWDSLEKEYTGEPDLWFHDVLRKDGTPYKQEEVDYIRSLTGATTASAAKSDQPNIVMIMTDDMGYADISSFAETDLKVKTANIDRLASEGIKFTQFYVAMPICSPSRAAIVTGMFAPETQLTSFLNWRKNNYDADQNDYLDPALAHFPKSFQAAGYFTAHVGKWHLGGGFDVDNAPSILKFGYDECYAAWESPAGDRDPKLNGEFAQWGKQKIPGQVDRWDRTRYMVDKTLSLLKSHSDKPCFITLWPDDLHTPYWPNPEMLKKYGGDLEKDRSIENFYGVLEEYDRQIGRFLDGLKAQGMEDNTIVIFTGDNGPAPHYDQARADGLRGIKLSLYEGGIAQPLIIRWPGHTTAGAQNDETVFGAIDLFPTLASLAGIEVPENIKNSIDGEDLSAAVLGERVKRNSPLMWEYGRNEHVPRPAKELNRSPELAIRKGKFKLLVNRDGSDAELYNVVKDRKESTNLADKRTTKTKRMAKQVIKWSESLPDRTHAFTPKVRAE